jgi:hypothetical protein
MMIFIDKFYDPRAAPAARDFMQISTKPILGDNCILTGATPLSELGCSVFDSVGKPKKIAATVSVLEIVKPIRARDSCSLRG